MSKTDESEEISCAYTTSFPSNLPHNRQSHFQHMSQDNEQMRQTNDASTSTYLPGQILQAHKFRGLTEDGAEAENSRF